MEQDISNIDFSKGDGIVPVIVQDANTKEGLVATFSCNFKIWAALQEKSWLVRIA